MDDRTAHALPLCPMTNSINTLSRRRLLQAGALAAAATLVPSAADAQMAGMSMGGKSAHRAKAARVSYAPATLKGPTPDADLPVRLGLATYTFRQFPDPAKLIDFAHQLKTPFLNLKSMHLPLTPLDHVAALADAYRAAGFILTAAGNISFSSVDDADIRPKFEYMKAARIPIMVCMPTREVLPHLEPYVKEYDIKLAIHNHGPEDKDFPSPFDVLTAVKHMDPRIGLCMDLGHALRAGADVIEAVHVAGPRLYDLHIKDLADVIPKATQVAVGEGVMPVRALFQALIETGYKGDVDLEYEIHGDDPMPGVVESFAYMRGVLAGMGHK
jgi:sugar phosphate isomerase/epimerase